MKKVVLVLSIVIIFVMNSLSFVLAQGEKMTNEEVTNVEETVVTTVATTDEVPEDLTPASEKILKNNSKKERKIAEYTDKYNDETMARVAYVLDLIQIYSIPVCIIGLAVGALNFYIIGQKKLDKQEKGFSIIMGFLCGLVFFQVLPFVFALLVAGK